MTRFREEHYATQAHRTWVKVQRANHPGHPQITKQLAEMGSKQERDALRSAYFAGKRKGKKAPQASWRLDG
jgi:hypothetical protein